MPVRRLLRFVLLLLILLSAGGRLAQAQTPPFSNGWYWDPNFTGMGFSFETHGSQMFVGIYTYIQPDPNFVSSSFWYAGFLSPDATGAWVGTLYQYSGGQTLGGAYQAPTSATPTYAALLRITGTDAGTLIFNQSFSYTLQRFQFGASLSPGAGMPTSGWWWNSAEAGRGWFFEVQGTQVYFAGYMYRDGGTPVWYYGTTAAPVASTPSFAGTFRACTGGPSLGGSAVSQTSVNCVISTAYALVFNSSTSATLTLATGQQIALSRFGF
jgi:hypothetical protein